MISNSETDVGLDDLLNRHFAGRVVRKDLTKLVKEGANVPVYVLEYLLGANCASNDEQLIQLRKGDPDKVRITRRLRAESQPRKPLNVRRILSTMLSGRYRRRKRT